jgi:NAD(P)-dependent dehydrogenase (short-subunit alcohol dehydrogenase family)
MARVVITGANRGIGYALVERYAESGDTVLALCRSIDKAVNLRALAESSSRRVIVGAIDISDQASVDQAARLAQGSVDILINNAGILGGEDQSIENIDVDAWRNAFDVMAIGPFRVTRAFVPSLEKTQGKVIFISSQAAASTWPYGGHYAYCSAKAAGNRVAQIMALDLRGKGISVASVHPGHVMTDMGGPAAEISPAESAAGIHRVAAGLNLETSGAFFKWNGDRHPF